MKMPWGMYAGRDTSELPSGYLEWCLEVCGGMHELLADSMRRELAGRADSQPTHLADASAGCPPTLASVVRSWRGRVFREFHPDRNGGDEATFIRVSAAVEDLLESLRGCGIGV